MAAEAVGPRCAVIPDAGIGETDQSVVSLIQVHLANQREMTMVDRESIDTVLHEQALSLAFGADGAASRMQLGELLRADVLILLRPLPGEGDGMQMVVSETSRGLRLAVDALRFTKDEAESAAEAVTGRIVESISKVGRADMAICAVPPFVSDDLSFEYDHLKQAYAELIEQTLLRSGKWLVVEFAEAAAIQDEIKTAGGGVQREMPLYVLGSFHTSGASEDRQISVSISVRRGDVEMGRVSGEAMLLAEATRFVQQTSGALLSKAVGAAVTPVDPHEEVTQLNARAETFARIGSRGEAINLYQASLLLDPAQSAVHLKLVQLISSHVLLMADRRMATALWVRGCDHLIYVLRHVSWDMEDATWKQFASRDGLAMTEQFLREASPRDEDGQWPEEVYRGRRLVRDAMIASFSDREMPAGEQRQHAWHLVTLVAAGAAFYGEDASASYAAKARAMYALGDAIDRYRYAMRLTRMEDYDLDHYGLHLASMKDAGDPVFGRFIVDRMLDVVDDRQPRFGPTSDDARTAQAEVARDEEAVGYKSLLLSDPVIRGGWIATPFGRDLICSKHAIDRMDERGRVTRLVTSDAKIDGACFDGRYLWAAVAAGDASVIVIDAKTEAIRRFGPTSGLPSTRRGATIAAISEGKVLVSGAFDGEDSRCAAGVRL